MLVDFDEFFEWYITQHEARAGPGNWDGLKRAFDSAKGKRDVEKHKNEEDRQHRELEDAQVGFPLFFCVFQSKRAFSP